jgi:hydroxymethylglutaryl-CoA lyase
VATNDGEVILQRPQTVTICEVGPRDGLQNEQHRFSTAEKVELIEMAVEAGATIVEIGSFVHPKAVPQMADTDEVARRLQPREGVEYRALVMNVKGIERAEAAGIKKVKLSVSASRAHSLANMKRTPEEVVRSFAECAEYADVHGLEMSGAISTAFGCSMEGRVPLERVLSVIACFREIGVSELSLSDTTGMANPWQVNDYCLQVKRQFPEVTWNLHFHNTRGMGLANVVGGMLAGVTRYDASFAGLGGCPFAPGASGNIATEDVVHMCHEMGIHTGYDLHRLVKVGNRIQEILGRKTESFVLRAGSCDSLTGQGQQHC